MSKSMIYDFGCFQTIFNNFFLICDVIVYFSNNYIMYILRRILLILAKNWILQISISGCQMISTIGVHQPPQTPAIRSANNSASYNHTIQHYNPLALNGIVQPERRLLNLQFLDLTDCTSLEDSGLKMIVECCPQLLYLFMRRCSTLTGKN